MPGSLVGFIQILRTHELRVSPAESLDAVGAAALLGYQDRNRLRDGLCMTLAKSLDERRIFLHCFDRYFHRSIGDFSPARVDAADRDTGTAIPSTPAGREAGGASGTPSPLEQAGQADPRVEELLGSPLLRALTTNDRNTLSLAIGQAAERSGIREIRIFTQKGLYTRRILAALGEEQLRAGIVALEQAGSPALVELQRYRDILREQVRDYIDRQYLLHAEGRNRRLMDDLLLHTRLSNIERAHLQRVEELVRRMARKLAARYAPRRRKSRRGQLDLRRTLRRGAANDGMMFDLHWRRVHRERPQIFALCDVSGSVAPYAKFLLLFLFGLQDVLPRVRSFAFSNRLGEVSALFAQYPVEQAIELANQRFGGATDYGASLRDFANLALEDVRGGSTVIILGDARNNYGDPRLDILRRIYQRANRVIWLNPESRAAWGTGDSEMPRYRSACHFTAECNTLLQFERVVERLLKNAR